MCQISEQTASELHELLADPGPQSLSAVRVVAWCCFPCASLLCSSQPLPFQLSLSQLLASPQSRDERAVPRSRSAPVPRACSTQRDGRAERTAGITHLEADLRSGSPSVDASSSEHLWALPFVPTQLPVTAVGLPAGR